MKLLSTFLLAIVVSISSLAQEIGIQLYSVRNQIPGNVEATLKQIKSWGITKLEGGSTYGMTQTDFNSLCKKIGLSVVSVGVDFKELESDPAKVAEKAKAFGAKYVMCAWIPHKGVQMTFDETQYAIKVFQNAGKILAANGLTFCYHIHGFEFDKYEDGTIFDLMVASLDPKYVNFEMDVFWVKQPGQDPVALLKKYPNRFPLVHLKDRKIGTPNSLDGHADDDTNVVLGTGDPVCERFFIELAGRYPNLLYLRGFDEAAAEALYGSGDLFLMPSTFEPCGISQMLAMRSGQPCLVHDTGGLADTVDDDINGFSFGGETADAAALDLTARFRQVVTLWQNDADLWNSIRVNAAAARFEWQTSARSYTELLYVPGP